GDVGVLGHRLGARVDVRVVDVDQLADLSAAGQTNGREVHEGEEKRARLRTRPVREGPESIGARIAGGDGGGRPRDADQLVGGEANADMGADVRVEGEDTTRAPSPPRVDAL